MTGELTLTGLVMPIGGVKEKAIAAKRAGIADLILPKENQKDFDELPAHIKRGLRPCFVETFPEVVNAAFGKGEASGRKGGEVRIGRPEVQWRAARHRIYLPIRGQVFAESPSAA